MIPAVSVTPSPIKPTKLDNLHPAMRLGVLVLGVITAMVATPVQLAVLLAVVLTGLFWTGLTTPDLVARIKPWWFIVVLVLVTHTLTTVAAAPLGHPSMTGFLTGCKALARVACTICCLSLYSRITPIESLIEGVNWWLRPFKFLGLPTEELGLMLAVTMGTTPVVLAEGRRIEMATRLRRSGNIRVSRTRLIERPGTWLSVLIDRARIVIPVMETLGRRADALSLTLRHRRPTDTGVTSVLPIWQLLILILWSSLLLVLKTNLLTGGSP